MQKVYVSRTQSGQWGLFTGRVLVTTITDVEKRDYQKHGLDSFMIKRLANHMGFELVAPPNVKKNPRGRGYYTIHILTPGVEPTTRNWVETTTSKPSASKLLEHLRFAGINQIAVVVDVKGRQSNYSRESLRAEPKKNPRGRKGEKQLSRAILASRKKKLRAGSRRWAEEQERLRLFSIGGKGRRMHLYKGRAYVQPRGIRLSKADLQRKVINRNPAPSRQIFVQVKRGEAWQTIGSFRDAPELRTLAKRVAKTYKRQHPASVVRVVKA